MNMSETVDVEDQEASAADGDEAEKKNPHKHEARSAADLEKVTDYVEETEISSQASASAVNLFSKENEEQRVAREKEMAKVIIRKEDIELMVKEMDISRVMAERFLRQYHGNVKDALVAIITST